MIAIWCPVEIPSIFLTALFPQNNYRIDIMQRLPVSSTLGRVSARCVPAHQRCAALPTEDPETRVRRYGKESGKTYSRRESDDWLHSAPQVRVRQTADRAIDQIGELAALNERLLGNNEAWIIRKRVEYLKKKRAAWEGVYDTACKNDAALTLDALEKAMSEVWYHARLFSF